jgi:hypothetical protein
MYYTQEISRLLRQLLKIPDRHRLAASPGAVCGLKYALAVWLLTTEVALIHVAARMLVHTTPCKRTAPTATQVEVYVPIWEMGINAPSCSGDTTAAGGVTELKVWALN